MLLFILVIYYAVNLPEKALKTDFKNIIYKSPKPLYISYVFFYVYSFKYTNINLKNSKKIKKENK